MSPPELHLFAISHYCEKARWALDHFEIDHTLRHLAPGAHREIATGLGARTSSLPILVVGQDVIQGSAEILQWAESASEHPGRSLRPAPALDQECLAIERRLDDVAGVHARRFYYSEALVEYPESVKPIFRDDLPSDEQAQLDEHWPLISQVMASAMDLGADQGEESRRILEHELDWLDERLAGGRRYLVGDRLSRADLTAASLLAPLALPEEHPTYSRLSIPPRVADQLADWAGRPTLDWVRQVYRDHRLA
jgi:glutathione S-transferase